MLNQIFVGFFVVLCVASLVGWGFVIRRIRAGANLIPHRRFEYPFGFVDVVIYFLFWSFSQVASISLAMWMFGISQSDFPDLNSTQVGQITLVAAVGQVLSTVLVMLVLLGRYKNSAIFGWQPGRLVGDIQLGLVAFLLTVPWLLLIQSGLAQWVEYNHATLDLMGEGSWTTLVIGWFGAGLVAPVCEELFFRGMVQGWLQRLTPRSKSSSDEKMLGGWSIDPNSQFELVQEMQLDVSADAEPSQEGFSRDETNPYAATAVGETPVAKTSGGGAGPIQLTEYWPVLVTAALFGVAHIGQGPAPLTLFLFGLVLGALFFRTGSIVACIVLHMMLNTFSLFWYTLGVVFGGDESTQTAWAMIESATHWQ